MVRGEQQSRGRALPASQSPSNDADAASKWKRYSRPFRPLSAEAGAEVGAQRPPRRRPPPQVASVPRRARGRRRVPPPFVFFVFSVSIVTEREEEEHTIDDVEREKT